MSGVFDSLKNVTNPINRNTFDWSHVNNFTTGFGRLTPVLCEYCPPNTSLRIKPQFGLRFMPMMFPVQTRIKAYLSFYRVPIRTLWKDYKDWVSSANDQTSDLEPPYLDLPIDSYTSGYMRPSGLADYLGIPNDITFNDSDLSSWTISTVSQLNTSNTSSLVNTKDYYFFGVSNLMNPAINTGNGIFSYELNYQRNISGYPNSAYVLATFSQPTFNFRGTLKFSFSTTQSSAEAIINDVKKNKTWSICLSTFGQQAAQYYNYTNINPILTVSSSMLSIENNTDSDSTSKPKKLVLTIPSFSFSVSSVPTNSGIVFQYRSLMLFWRDHSYNGSNNDENSIKEFSITQSTNSNLSNQPYYSSDLSAPDAKYGIKLSAYPFRAYEAVYNAYIRNNKNNPFYIDDKVSYNKWIPNDNGGADKYAYQLHHSNWASDQFTTAVPSPQQGQAPLVGITTYTKTVALENGHSETTVGTALVDEDGNKYDVSYESNGDELKDVKYTLLNADTPVRPVSNLFDLVTSGISINDFRNVNAYQRYLELNQMRGYSYKDIVEGRFDVNVRYDDLNMPEYLGGMTRDVSISPVTQTQAITPGSWQEGTYSTQLGAQAGNGTLFADGENISCFCDEESFVIGILSVCPMPVYTQVLPKHFLYRDRLDYFAPEFDHIGFQPIPLKEIAPINTYFTLGRNHLDDTFGYQRPWYEFCQKLDTAHGLFKTDLRNFLINRVFGGVPSLNSAFTTMDENDLNDVFAVTDISDKILGAIWFDITAKLPISRVSVPRLE
ncbi:major capsid protein [Lepus americanus faeces associated microvirus SHP1 6472]|uniref:major capsid protein n=1 Tax=Lepus americanus faeces associated microvirus SHP1 6472 TaxID=2219217 RepID=UPI000DF05608|nr:major capsid protein [Lepus americanus faeces associated microvirus SHP1 6472]AXB22590.1 major capsid protein [Lepus americanus faeces associated microvirus SHP1 6472]